MKDTLEATSKFTAALVVVVYASGFLITSLHSSTYGFAVINPLRPKILSAGAWFLLFSGIPVVVAWTLRKEVVALLRIGDWKNFGESLVTYYGFCFVLSILSAPLFNYSPSTATPAWKWTPILIFLVAAALTTAVFLFIKSRVLFVVIVAIWIAWLLYSFVPSVYHLSKGQVGYSEVLMWFFLLSVFTVAEYWLCSRNPQRWPQTVFLTLGLLFVFARCYYPYIKASWGGGSPVPVVLYLSKSAPFSPGKQQQLLLLDESDAGFYVVSPGELKAIFVPRDAVGLIYFSENASDSKLLGSGVSTTP